MKIFIVKLIGRPETCNTEQYNCFWEDVIISNDFVLKLSERPCQPLDMFPLHEMLCPRCDSKCEMQCPKCDLKCFVNSAKRFPTVAVDGHLFSKFVTLLTLSKKLRTDFLNKVYRNLISSDLSLIKEYKCLHCNRKCIPITLQVTVQWPSKQILDYNWNRKLEDLVNKYCELDTVLAWLSTLGGGFSSLGESSLQFAEKAQLTSVHQMMIAKELNNPLLMSRCRLYFAISLLQKWELKKARRIVQNEFEFAKWGAGNVDHRLLKMCLGIWAKLKYMHHLKLNSLTSV